MRTTGTRECSSCRYWSEMVAQAIGARGLEALCLSSNGPEKGKYMAGTQTCAAFAKNSHGAVDEPPNYGEAAQEAYAAEAAKKHDNGQPMFAPDGTMLDENGNRSIFDDLND